MFLRCGLIGLGRLHIFPYVLFDFDEVLADFGLVSIFGYSHFWCDYEKNKK